jgi:hypothetical protein
MKRTMVVLAVMLALFAGRAPAQDTATPSFNPDNKARLDQTKKSLVTALESESPGLQATAAQTVRELKAMLPEESFSLLVIPLMGIVKNGDAQVEARILAALALSDLHSDRGDFAIKMEAKHCESCRLGYILGALAVQRAREVQFAHDAAAKEKSPDIAVAR